jgi:hypothetical protein
MLHERLATPASTYAVHQARRARVRFAFVRKSRGQTHQSSRFAAWTLREAREEMVARAGAANAALEPAKFALAPRTARTAVTEEVVRAAIFANELEAWGMCA